MIKIIAILVFVAFFIIYETLIKGKAIKEKKKALETGFDKKDYHAISVKSAEMGTNIRSAYGKVNDQYKESIPLHENEPAVYSTQNSNMEMDGTPLSIGIFTYQYHGKNTGKTLYSRPFHHADEQSMKLILEKKEFVDIYINKKNEHDYFIDI